MINNNKMTNEQKQKNRLDAQSKILQYMLEYIMNAESKDDNTEK